MCEPRTHGRTGGLTPTTGGGGGGALPVPAPLHPDQPTPHPQRLASSKAHTSRFITASLPCNKFKNRLVNILPYESSRVCLQPIRGVEGSDYINASFIDGYRCTGPAFRGPPLSLCCPMRRQGDLQKKVWGSGFGGSGGGLHGGRH